VGALRERIRSPDASGSSRSESSRSATQTSKEWLVHRSTLLALPVLVLLVTGCTGPTGRVDFNAPTDSPTRTSETPQTQATRPSGDADPQPDYFAHNFGMFREMTWSGSGDGLVTLPRGAKFGVVHAHHTGTGGFAITGLDAAGKSNGVTLVDTTGSYDGTTAYGLADPYNYGLMDAVNALPSLKRLRVAASGAWTVSINPIDSLPGLPSTGAGDGVYKYWRPGVTAVYRVTHQGPGPFDVLTASADPEVYSALYKGSAMPVTGHRVVVVKSDGPWTIAFQKRATERLGAGEDYRKVLDDVSGG
jgi:hypothetical protein